MTDDVTIRLPEDGHGDRGGSTRAVPRAACNLSGDSTWSCWADGHGHGRAGSLDAEIETFKLACEHFRHDISSFWTQSNFFFLVQGALISFFVSDIGPQDPAHTHGLVSARVEALMLAVAGIVFALMWSLVSTGRQRFIREWRNAVVHLDGVVDRHHVYVGIEEKADRDKLNPITVTAWVPRILAVGWLVVIVYFSLVHRQVLSS